MKIMNLALLLSLLALPAHATKIVGNGGDGVVCRDANQQITSVRLLDYFEATDVRELPLDPTLSQGANDYKEIIARILNRLERFSPGRAARYRARAARFEAEASFKDVRLVDIPDSAHVAFPEGCKVEQVVIRQQVQFPEDRLFLVDQSLWTRLPALHQAGLVLHEMVYEEALLRYQHENSVGARYVNALLATQKLASMSDRDFVQALKAARFNETDVLGAFFSLDQSSIRYAQDGSYAMVTKVPLTQESFPHLKVVPGTSRDGGDLLAVRVQKATGGNPRISAIYLDWGLKVIFQVKDRLITAGADSLANDLYFYEDGSIEYGATNENSRITERRLISRDGKDLPLPQQNFIYKLLGHGGDFSQLQFLGTEVTFEGEPNYEPKTRFRLKVTAGPFQFTVKTPEGEVKTEVPTNTVLSFVVPYKSFTDKNRLEHSLPNSFFLQEPELKLVNVEPASVKMAGSDQIIPAGLDLRLSGYAQVFPAQLSFTSAKDKPWTMNVPKEISFLPSKIQVYRLSHQRFVGSSGLENAYIFSPHGLKARVQAKDLDVVCDVMGYRDWAVVETCFKQAVTLKRSSGGVANLKPGQRVRLYFDGLVEREL